MRKVLRFFGVGPTAKEVVDSSVRLLRDIQSDAIAEAATYDKLVAALVKRGADKLAEADRASRAAASLELLGL